MEVTDEGGASIALEILDTEAKRPGGTEPGLGVVQISALWPLPHHHPPTLITRSAISELLSGPHHHPFWAPVGLTLFGRADEVPDTPNTAIILALRFIQLHAHPLAAGKLRGPAEPQRACLRKQDRLGGTVGGPDRSLTHRQHGEVDEGAPGSNLSSDITIY